MTERIPQAIWTGTFRLFGVDVRCAVLDTGQRVIEAESMTALLEAMSDPSPRADAGDAEDIEAFARWQKGVGQ